MKTKITKRKVDELRGQAPAAGRTVYAYDTELSGFGVWVTRTGAASFFIEYRLANRVMSSRRMAIGRYGRITADAARQRAKELLAQVTGGTDVARIKAEERRAVTVAALIPVYLKARRDDLRPSSHSEARRYLERAWAPLHGLPAAAVSRQDVIAALGEIEEGRGKVAADRARAHLSSLFGWAIDRGHCGANPTQNIRQRANGGSRERVLSEAELIAIWRACGDDDYGCIVRLLILTGQRKTEIADLQWREIDFGRRQILLPAERAKNHREHIVPLHDVAMAILRAAPRRLRRDFVFGNGARGFQGWSRAKAALDARLANANMAGWTIHDLRRSVATHLGENGFAQPHIVEAVLNHVSGTKARVAGVYNKAAYANEKRQALDLWGTHLVALTEGRDCNVVVLEARR